jgi:hypothetical protein
MRTLTHRRFAALLTTAVVAIVTSSMLSADVAGATRRPIPHPTLAGSVVLRVSTTNNFWGGSYDDGDTITVAGDGLVTIVPERSSVRRKHPAPQVVQAGEAALQKILRRARRIGLLSSKQIDTGGSFVTDQGTTTIEVHAASVNRTIDVYALLLPDGDHGLTRHQRYVRRALRAFIHDLTLPGYYQVVHALD